MDWKNEYSVGLLEIDDQHKELLRLFSAVEGAIARGGDPRDVVDAIEDLAEAVRYHFWFENGLMRLFNFPGAAEHADKHDKMFAALKQIQRTVVGNPSYGELQTFLQNWLLKHICSTDRDYVAWIVGGAPVVRS